MGNGDVMNSWLLQVSTESIRVGAVMPEVSIIIASTLISSKYCAVLTELMNSFVFPIQANLYTSSDYIEFQFYLYKFESLFNGITLTR